MDVEIAKNGHVYLTGPVSGVAKGVFSADFKKLLG